MIAGLYAHLGAEIRRRREGLGLSQAQLADKIGVGRTSITMMERGAQAILVHQLLEIARALKVSPERLLPKADMSPTVDADHDNSGLAGALALLSELEPLGRITR